MRFLPAVAFAALIATWQATSAHAAEFPVSDQDQTAISTICEIAARSPAVAIEVNAEVAQYCVGWKRRMQAAAAPKPQPAPEGKREGAPAQ